MSTAVMEPGLTNKVRDSQGDGLSGGSQVVIYNDSHNAYGYVVKCVMAVFKHSESLAEKITQEAHTKGRAIAEVEEPEKARDHAQQMCALGIRAAAEGF
jgi:ATP-dependent Clp protease adapter protein ClpS